MGPDRLGAIALVLLAGCAERAVSASTGADASASDAAPTVAIADAEPPPAGPVRVLVAGDLIPHRPALAQPESIKNALAPMIPLFAKGDAVVANYEAATGDVDPNAFRLAYAVPKQWIAELPGAGIAHVTVANNHACDLGEPGLYATLEAAKESGLDAIGGDMQDAWTPRVLATRGGKRVCAVAWTTIVNADEGPCARSPKLAVASIHGYAGKSRIDAAIKRARASCDAVIAIMHGGEEYRKQTTLVMDQAAHAAEVGADAVVIHHPHIASPILIHTTRDDRRVPIFASIGNLVANQGESWKPPMFPVLRENRRLVCVNGWTRLGLVADLDFRFDASPPRLDWNVHITWIDNEHVEHKDVAVPKISARLLDPKADEDVVARLSDDPIGPVDLFTEPCWTERPNATDDPRCHVPLVKPVFVEPSATRTGGRRHVRPSRSR
ncbi:MAG TPA: CapA family protein [Labilithrix sp.]|jgi:poly-gamma-glutamate synthesis protein (capsule biosynthesis protein)